MMSEQSDSQLPRRKRISRACDRCRMRKDKCDGVHPACGACQTSRQTCSYEPRLKKRGLPEGYVYGLEKLLALSLCNIDGFDDNVLTLLTSVAGSMGQDRQYSSIWKDDVMSERLREVWKASRLYSALENALMSNLPFPAPAQCEPPLRDLCISSRAQTTRLFLPMDIAPWSNCTNIVPVMDLPLHPSTPASAYSALYTTPDSLEAGSVCPDFTAASRPGYQPINISASQYDHSIGSLHESTHPHNTPSILAPGLSMAGHHMELDRHDIPMENTDPYRSDTLYALREDQGRTSPAAASSYIPQNTNTIHMNLHTMPASSLPNNSGLHDNPAANDHRLPVKETIDLIIRQAQAENRPLSTSELEFISTGLIYLNPVDPISGDVGSPDIALGF
ncbi:hypothetical protein BJX99DRAFT_151000 [Aspergillus californicus]